MSVPFLTAPIMDQLVRNGLANAVRIEDDGNTIDFFPVVKLFTPDAACTWLLTEVEPGHPDIAFGLCDLGMGCPELGSVSLSEIASVRGRAGLPVERDRHFKATHPLSTYADLARQVGRIMEIGGAA